MENPVVLAYDINPPENRNIRYVVAHGSCAKPTRFSIVRELKTEFDYRDRKCGICDLPLLRSAHAPPVEPRERTISARPRFPGANQVHQSSSNPYLRKNAHQEREDIVLVHRPRTDELLKAHRSCVTASQDRIVRPIKNGLYWRNPNCDICGKPLERTL